MKFLCIPCDEQMETQMDGIMPTENKNLVMKFKCKKCGHMIAMLTNQFETEFVSKIGVELGGASNVGSRPLSMVGSQLSEAKKELDKGKPEANLVWTEEAQLRIKKVPFFVRNMAKKTIINFALQKGVTLIDAKLMDEVREKVGM